MLKQKQIICNFFRIAKLSSIFLYISAGIFEISIGFSLNPKKFSSFFHTNNQIKCFKVFFVCHP